MYKKTIMFAMAVALALTFVTPVAAVQYGQPDGNGHPYVGLVVFHNANNVPLWRCSGALISSNVFLTAAHCTEAPAAKAVIWFSPGPINIGDWGGPGTSCAGKGGYPCTGDAAGTPIPHPGWTGTLTIPNTHDVGVVVLDNPVISQGFGQLAPAGYLDTLATRRGLQNVEFTVVGYGLQLVKPVLLGERTRYVGTTHLINLTSALADGYNIHYSNEPGQGHGGPGGTCFGDSGGPVLHKNAQRQEVIVGVNSFVLNANCKGSAFAYRMDIPDARDFLDDFVVVP
jgi:hypothetical protein